MDDERESRTIVVDILFGGLADGWKVTEDMGGTRYTMVIPTGVMENKVQRYVKSDVRVDKTNVAFWHHEDMPRMVAWGYCWNYILDEYLRDR